MFKINRFTGLIAFMTLFAATNAASLPSFVADEIATLDWGNGLKQVALDRAPANNFGPKRLLIENTGTALYVLDASNQRIWTFNLTTEQFSAIDFSDSTAADDFCVLDNGEHFYLLFSDQKQVVLYNQHANALKKYRIKKKAASRGQKTVYRQQVIELARKYANQSFWVNSANITSKRYLGGKYVITPISSPSRHTGIPYKWCGDDTIATVLSGLRYGKKAGDRCTKCRGRYCGSREAVGVDCSGLISELWQLGQKYSTRN
jgi:cell wall-associated NlpC family hydrolase